MKHILLACTVLCVAVSTLPAQAIRGKIVGDSAAAPIQGVLVSLLNERGDTVTASVRSDANGDFVLRVKDPGRYRIRATRLAFDPVFTNVFQLGLREITDVRLVMTRQVQLLTPQVVVGSRIMSGAEMMSAEGYEWRRLRYTGFFTDTLTLRRAGYPPLTVHLKEFVPGLTTVLGFFGNEEIRMQVAGQECIPDLYKDGTIQQSLAVMHINSLNSADFYGVEVYRRPNIPLEFQRTGSDCAVIALWSKWFARRDGGGR